MAGKKCAGMPAMPVQYQVVGAPAGAWTTVVGTITRPHHTVLGLAPATDHNFQVLAANANGPATAVSIGPIATPAQPAPPAGVPGLVSGLYVDGVPTLSSVKLAWSVPACTPTGYVVEIRHNDTTEAWTIVDRPATSGCIVDKLAIGIACDYQVSAANAAGRGLPSAVITETTQNEPEWSDLIVTGDGRGEIDVTRAQMLLFTLVAALFVGMNVLTNFTIPDVPPGVLLLMGISNGVYLTAKFIHDYPDHDLWLVATALLLVGYGRSLEAFLIFAGRHARWRVAGPTSSLTS